MASRSQPHKKKRKKSKYDFDQKEAKRNLAKFFRTNRKKLAFFGSRVHHTYEAFVFAKILKAYRENGWTVRLKHPPKTPAKTIKLKFSTNGAPKNYSYALCQKHRQRCQIRHQLRVQTAHSRGENRSNMCCDVAIIKDISLDTFDSKTALRNSNLILFGEAKHQGAYAELCASFVGLVHELTPRALKGKQSKNHIMPFLYIVGTIYDSAQGMIETWKHRKFAIEVRISDGEVV